MINKELIKQVILEQREYFLKKQTGIRRTAMDRIMQKVSLPHIHVITGLRRSGKSILLRQIVKELFNDVNFYYLNFEDERLLNFNATQFNLVYESMLELYGPQTNFFIDEIQHVRDFDSFVRRFYDQGFRFYLTGSNADLLQEEISTRLTGRHIDTYLQPFSFPEFLSAKKISISTDGLYRSEERAPVISLFDEYLVKGGMPEYTFYQDNEIIRRTYEDIVTRDIFFRKKVENILAAKELYLYLIGNFAQRFSYNSLQKAIPGISINTVKKYTEFLVSTYFSLLINRFDFSVQKQMVNDKKIFICDNAFVVNLSTRVGVDKGWLLENLVMNRLSTACTDLFYYSGNRECDAVTVDQKQVTGAFQVCWELNHTNEKRELDGLLEAMDRTGVPEGMVLTYNQEEIRTVKNKTIQIKPVWKWLLQ